MIPSINAKRVLTVYLPNLDGVWNQTLIYTKLGWSVFVCCLQPCSCSILELQHVFFSCKSQSKFKYNWRSGQQSFLETCLLHHSHSKYVQIYNICLPKKGGVPWYSQISWLVDHHPVLGITILIHKVMQNLPCLEWSPKDMSYFRRASWSVPRFQMYFKKSACSSSHIGI